MPRVAPVTRLISTAVLWRPTFPVCNLKALVAAAKTCEASATSAHSALAQIIELKHEEVSEVIRKTGLESQKTAIKLLAEARASIGNAITKDVNASMHEFTKSLKINLLEEVSSSVEALVLSSVGDIMVNNEKFLKHAMTEQTMAVLESFQGSLTSAVDAAMNTLVKEAGERATSELQSRIDNLVTTSVDGAVDSLKVAIEDQVKSVDAVNAKLDRQATKLRRRARNPLGAQFCK